MRPAGARLHRPDRLERCDRRERHRRLLVRVLACGGLRARRGEGHDPDDADHVPARRRALVPRPRRGRRGELGPGRARRADPNRHVPARAAGALEPEPPGRRRLDRTIDVAWSGASDAQSGLDGFAVSWTQGSRVASDGQEPGGDRLAGDEPQLAVGAWWFNIRAVDNAGNWSDAVSVGPFSIRLGPAACSVPRLRSLTLVAAKRLLTKRGCSLGRVSRVRSRRVARGRVVAHEPRAGHPPGPRRSCGSFSAAVAAKTARVW